MNEYGVITEPGAVRLERTLPGPIERVWDYLTDPEKRGKWLASGPMELHVGDKVELRFRHAELSSQIEPTPERYKQYEGGHVMAGRVTALEPPRFLSYTWGDAEESEVTFELTAREGRVQLVLTHRKLADRSMMVSVAGGWHTHLTMLIDRLNGVEPPSFWSRHTAIAAAYQERFPAA